MKIIRSIAAAVLALALISNVNLAPDNRLVEASEIPAAHNCDHSACEREIAHLKEELEEAANCSILLLRIELEIAPGLLGEWAQIEFLSDPIKISAEAAQNLSVGDNLCQEEEEGWNLLACRIIVEELLPCN